MRTFALAGAVSVLLVPGSGWRGADAYDGERMSIGAAAWRDWGMRAKVVPHGPGQTGLADVAEALAAERARRPRARICLYGESSGGTWALVAAAAGADCVAVSAAPTDADTWRRSKRRVARSFAHRIWPAFFGTGAADDPFEPVDVWRATTPDVPAFYVAAANDPTVPPQQGRVFRRAAPGSLLRVLRPGDARFVHSSVRAGQLRRVRAELRRFVRGQ